MAVGRIDGNGGENGGATEVQYERGATARMIGACA